MNDEKELYEIVLNFGLSAQGERKWKRSDVKGGEGKKEREGDKWLKCEKSLHGAGNQSVIKAVREKVPITMITNC